MKQKLIKIIVIKRCLVYLKSKVNICVITFMIVSIEIKNPPIETKIQLYFKNRFETCWCRGIGVK